MEGNLITDIASGRIEEVRKRNMSCFAGRAPRSKNAEAFLNNELLLLNVKYTLFFE